MKIFLTKHIIQSKQIIIYYQMLQQLNSLTKNMNV